MTCSRRKRLQLSRILFLLSGVFLCTLYQLAVSARLSEQWPMPQIGEDSVEGSTEGMEEATVETLGLEEPVTEASDVELTDQTESVLHTVHNSPTTLDSITSATTEDPRLPEENRTVVHCIYVAPEPPMETPPPPTPTPSSPSPPALTPSQTPSQTPSPPSQTPSQTPPVDSTTPSSPLMKGYPQDLFTVEDRRRGWVSLHIFGMVYMFVSLAIVCDEFFVPALGVITDKLAISDDVAGATFMAAGGSAPELFTSLIGVFISHSNVGIGTIVGSAVFNILFVIGMCAVSSREILHLTWWPLFRDVSFYILDLIMLIIFFLDNVIMWYESLMLVGGYFGYVCFMKYNVQLERAFKTLIRKHRNMIRIATAEEPDKDDEDSEDNVHPDPEDNNHLKLKPNLMRGGSSASLHNSTMRNTIFQLMIHTLDPLGEGKFKDKAQILNKVARHKSEIKAKPEGEPTKEPEASPAKDAEQQDQPEDKKEDVPAGEAGSGGSEDDDSDEDDDCEEESDEDSEEEGEDDEEKEEEETEEPLSLEWPDTLRKQATYLFLLPIVFPLWLTVPDVRNPKSKRFFGMTFLGSILWIGVFSYLMVWWAHQVGETIGISEEIMGLTILAAGTSIPDLITSVIVARKGLGDMAVSSSVGSNIFDITVGLPVPWLMYQSLHGFAPVQVKSNGLFCAIVLLFLMLLFVIASIASCKWKMNKTLGSTMFLLYIVFLVLSVMLEDRIIVCPVSI